MTKSQFNVKSSKNSITYQHRICKQKLFSLTSFEAHFGKRPNTPLSNISREPNTSYLSFKNVTEKYLDQDTANWTDLIPENKWDNPDKNDLEDEQNKTNPIKNAHERQIRDRLSQSRLVKIEEQRRPTPRTEEPVQLSLAEKISAQNVYKRT